MEPLATNETRPVQDENVIVDPKEAETTVLHVQGLLDFIVGNFPLFNWLCHDLAANHPQRFVELLFNVCDESKIYRNWSKLMFATSELKDIAPAILKHIPEFEPNLSLTLLQRLLASKERIMLPFFLEAFRTQHPITPEPWIRYLNDLVGCLDAETASSKVPSSEEFRAALLHRSTQVTYSAESQWMDASSAAHERTEEEQEEQGQEMKVEPKAIAEEPLDDTINEFERLSIQQTGETFDLAKFLSRIVHSAQRLKWLLIDSCGVDPHLFTECLMFLCNNDAPQYNAFWLEQHTHRLHAIAPLLAEYVHPVEPCISKGLATHLARRHPEFFFHLFTLFREDHPLTPERWRKYLGELLCEKPDSEHRMEEFSQDALIKVQINSSFLHSTMA